MLLAARTRAFIHNNLKLQKNENDSKTKCLRMLRR